MEDIKIRVGQGWGGGGGEVVYQYTRKKFAKIPKIPKIHPHNTQNYTQVHTYIHT